jgi:zona occludens toxin
MCAEAWKSKDKYFIIHNIVGFKTELLNGFGFDWLKYMTENNIEADVFFSKPYQIELSEKINEKYHRPMLVIIDEAHEWFDVHKKAIKMWLSYHGHLNQQIYLVAHASTNIPKVYRSFVETEYRAKSSLLFFLPGYFFYNRIAGGQKGGYIFERKDQKIFDLYKSSDIKEDRKKKSLMMPVIILFIVVGIGLFFYLPQKFMKHSRSVSGTESSINAGQKVNQSNVPAQFESKQVEEIKKNPDLLEEKYSYVGTMNGQAILEDRKTGVQFPLSHLPENWVVVTADRYIKCTAFNGLKLVTFYNFGRYVHQEEKQYNGGFLGDNDARQQSAAAEPMKETKI